LFFTLDSDASQGGFSFADELSKAKKRTASKPYKPIPPTVSFSSITPDGTISLMFSKDMIVPPLSKITNVTFNIP
jgi:hypothetical protein